jgi:hypothetical protein
MDTTTDTTKDLASAVADELEGRTPEAKLRAARASFSDYIRGGSTVAKDAEQSRDEAGRFTGEQEGEPVTGAGFDQGSRGGTGPKKTSGAAFLDGLLGRGERR